MTGPKTGTTTGTTLAPDGAPGRARRLASPLAVGGVTALAVLALHLRDPHARGSWGVCPTALVGFDCPLCGSLRAVHDLTNLDVASAASSNLLFVVAVPVILGLWVRRLVAGWRGGSAVAPVQVPRLVWWGLAAAVTLFTILRNLPAGAWFAS